MFTSINICIYFSTFLCCLLAIAFVIIDKWIDILFYPLVIIGDIMNKRRQQKDVESWWKENENSQEDDIV